MKKLESLFVKKMFLENLIKEAYIKGEANYRLERLEEALGENAIFPGMDAFKIKR